MDGGTANVSVVYYSPKRTDKNLGRIFDDLCSCKKVTSRWESSIYRSSTFNTKPTRRRRYFSRYFIGLRCITTNALLGSFYNGLRV